MKFYASLLLVMFLPACGDDVPTIIGGTTTSATTSATTGTTGTTSVTSVLEDVGGQTLEEATQVYLSKGNSLLDSVLVAETIGEPGDRDFFQFDLEEGAVALFATEAYHLDGDMVPDTVLRLYGTKGEMLAENDDMPFRFWETDSTLYFQAPATGTYFIEVLEWSDWDPDYLTPEGGPDYVYNLLGIQSFNYEDLEPNDTQKEADSLYDAYLDGLVSLRFSSYFTDSASEIFGQMHSKGDTDIWKFEYESDWIPTFSMWPTTLGTLNPQMSLYDADWNLLARTNDPIIDTTEFTAWYNFGILYPVKAKQTYYLEVKSETKSSGAGTFYPILYTGYTSDKDDDWEVEPNDDVDNANQVITTEWDSNPGYYYAYPIGNLAGEKVDSADVYVYITEKGVRNQYFSVLLQAEDVGSLLDAKITVLASDGKTVLATETTNDRYGGADPHIRDLFIKDDSLVFVKVESEAVGEHPDSNNYYLHMLSYKKPVYTDE